MVTLEQKIGKSLTICSVVWTQSRRVQIFEQISVFFENKENIKEIHFFHKKEESRLGSWSKSIKIDGSGKVGSRWPLAGGLAH
jgi:hypothetical protein